MYKSSTFISSYPLALNAVSLGRLVTFFKNPSQDFFDPTHELPDKPQVTSAASEINNISKVLQASKGTGLELALTAFASTFLKSESNIVRQLEAKQGIQHLLLNADDWFERICKSDLTRTWLERAAMRGKRAYLVTGLQTLTDVDLNFGRSEKHAGSFGVEVPLLAASGIPLPTPLDPAVKANLSIEGGSKSVGKVPDEKIYGVQYREIKLKKRSALVGANLTAKIWWEQICSDRGAKYTENSDDEEEEEDCVEAQLLGGLDNLGTGELASFAISEEEIYLY